MTEFVSSISTKSNRHDARDLDDVGFLRPVLQQQQPPAAPPTGAAAGAVPIAASAAAAAATGAAAPTGAGDYGAPFPFTAAAVVAIDRYQCRACELVLPAAEVDRIGAFS